MPVVINWCRLIILLRMSLVQEAHLKQFLRWLWWCAILFMLILVIRISVNVINIYHSVSRQSICYISWKLSNRIWLLFYNWDLIFMRNVTFKIPRSWIYFSRIEICFILSMTELHCLDSGGSLRFLSWNSIYKCRRPLDHSWWKGKLIIILSKDPPFALRR